ncbi:molybdopterin-dependent oxidoreductase [Streptomyces sp. SPB4]|uniref:molybdopterin-dependent oxidoreductase n=1 Tax=Streptomyces sp. SPB4 TaxID=2940553 RepID=UPI00247446DB|nr:molybdopterin-dependent oxidoreductase [Streptomyces sp. SPB4]MDH6543994.1 DMSO/TMAO reductase YedYZ molybdopterin-dependent catalytic subunit [Streptomyces sp. SPB4]
MPGVSSFRSILSRTARGALAGVLAAFTALAVAELVAGLVRPAAGPVTVVGGAVIDRTPAAVKDFAIRTFGENDKTVLQLGILVVLAVIAVGLGVLALSHRRVGAAGVLLFGIVGSAAALSRPDSTGIGDALPSIAGALAGALALYVLASRAAPVPAPAGADEQGGTDGWSRRGFLAAAGVSAVAAASAGALGRFFTGRQGQGAVASRDSLVLPAPASPAPALPAGVQLKVAGISPFTTPSADFYRVDTALTIPQVDAGTWRLRIHGKGVTRPRTYTLDQLLARPLVERDITLTCVSNEVGGPYIGTARWLGVPLADILREAGVRPPSKGGTADQLVARSVDGMTLGSPVEDVMDGRDAMLAVGMNGKPLPFEHGFPVRMLVPGLYGYVSACKWITDIELTTFDAYDPYWVKRKWARKAPIKTQARIDTPRPFARPAADTVTVAGVAWAQHRGITRVEIRIDDGPWQDADLASQAGVDTWRQWSYPWRATPGGHTVTVRATDGTRQVQTEQRARTIPDGASGWHSVFVTVS